MKQNPWACLRVEFAIRHSRCALAFASHGTARAHAYGLIERIAKPLRYCRIMHMKRRNDLPWKASQGEPRHGRRVSTVSSSIEAQKA